ncbi:MAG: hypothetical protein LAO55_23700 [Acidobacteriia bacterium]|nr:hypothetical protein [Terriglobia bacterium]
MAKKTTLKQRIDQLPELPVETLEVAGELGYADNVPVVTIRPNKFPKPAKPPGVLPAVNLSQYEQRFYWVQVTYPRVICSHPGDLLTQPGPMFVERGTRESGRPNAGVAAIAQRERFYKLMKLKGVQLRTSLWCSVKYGPWLAMVIEQTSCIAGEPSLWQFSIVEMPEVGVTWYGQWGDIPPLPSLTVIMGDLSLFDVKHFCCPGFTFCPTTMSCIPDRVHCQDAVPA